MILPDYEKGTPFYFRWEGFYAACKNSDTLPLLETLPSFDNLEDKAPPILGF